MALKETLNANFKQLSEENKINNAYSTGGISIENKLFEQLQQMKHSTFDRSKFTVVGSPTITDDGIASGFITAGTTVATKFLRISRLPSNISTVKIKGRLTKPSSAASNAYVFSEGLSSNYITKGYTILAYKNLLRFQIGNGSSREYVAVSFASLLDTFFFECSDNGTQLNIKVSSDGINWIEATPVTKTLTRVQSTTLQPTIGAYSTENGENFDAFSGAIDLKQFSIAVDGQEVFNGNKTGIDQIKKDDYTVVGNPTITDGGIASGFSTSNYITISYTNIQDSNNWEIVFNVDLTNDNSSAGGLISVTAGNGIILNSKRSTTNYQLEFFLSSVSTSWDIVNGYVLKLDEITEMGQYLINLSYKNEVYRLSAKNINTGVVREFERQSNLKIYQKPTQIGCRRNISAFYGSIDLNSFKIYVDGNLVYQPTLRIPYTQSKTGSKIVDAFYRDRVQDMYEQFGYAPYYTLGVNDFTLPMGEIYGMLNKKTDFVHIIDTYENGTSGYIIWSNGYCEQWGNTVVNGTATITLLKKFDVEKTGGMYTITSSIVDVWQNHFFKDLTNSSFKITTGGNTKVLWKASGYLENSQY